MSPVVTLPTVITSTHVEDAAISTLKPRLAYYCEQMKLPVPRAYIRAHQFDKWPEDQIPLVAVNCAGLLDQPTRHGDGRYTARWVFGIVALCSGKNDLAVHENARIYGALIRATILQQPSLGGFALGVEWLDETYDELDVKRRRTLSTAEITFSVEVEGVVNASELPLMPNGPLPTPSPYDVSETGITVNLTSEVNP